MTSATGTLFRPAFGVVWLYALLTTLAWAALLPILPLFVHGPLEGGDAAVGVVMSGAPLAGALVQPMLGRLADRRGRRVLLIGGPVVFGSAVALFSLVDSPEALFALRAIAGVGDAAFVVGAVTVVDDLAPERRRGEAYNIYSLASWAGLGLGPVIGELVLRTHSFDAVWVLCVGLSIAGAATALLLRDSRRGPAPPRSTSPIFSRAAALPGLSLALEMVGFASLLVFTPLYARELGMQGGGLVILVTATVLVSMRIFGRRVPDRLGARRAATAGLSLTALGLALFAVVAHPSALFAGAAVCGAGHALLYPALFMLAVGGASAYERSAAVGSLKACEALGFAAGASLLGVVASVAGYGVVFGLAAIVTMTGLLPMWLSRPRRSRLLRSQ